MKKLIAIAVGGLLASMLIAFGDSGSATVTADESATVRTYSIALTEGTNNNCTANIRRIDGEILKITILPAGGIADNYDVTLKDVLGHDLLAGLGANLSSNIAVQVIVPYVQMSDGTVKDNRAMPIAEATTLLVTNCNNSATGVLKLYVR